MAYILQSIPFLPENSSWEDWNGNMLHYFGEEPLPYLPEEQWKDFGKILISIPTFSSFILPDPDEFENWQGWAMAVVVAVNGRTQ